MLSYQKRIELMSDMQEDIACWNANDPPRSNERYYCDLYLLMEEQLLNFLTEDEVVMTVPCRSTCLRFIVDPVEEYGKAFIQSAFHQPGALEHVMNLFVKYKLSRYTHRIWKYFLRDPGGVREELQHRLLVEPVIDWNSYCVNMFVSDMVDYFIEGLAIDPHAPYQYICDWIDALADWLDPDEEDPTDIFDDIVARREYNAY